MFFIATEASFLRLNYVFVIINCKKKIFFYKPQGFNWNIFNTYSNTFKIAHPIRELNKNHLQSALAGYKANTDESVSWRFSSHLSSWETPFRKCPFAYRQDKIHYLHDPQAQLQEENITQDRFIETRS